MKLLLYNRTFSLNLGIDHLDWFNNWKSLILVKVLPVIFSVVSSDHTTTINEILQRYISDYLKYSILKKQSLMELNRTSQILQNRWTKVTVKEFVFQ